MGLAADKTILQVGGWLEDEKPSIADTQGFSLSVLFRWLWCVRGSAARCWPHMNNGSRTSGIDSSTEEVEQVREPAADQRAPLFPLFSLKSHNSVVISGLSNVICSVYCLRRSFRSATVMCTDMSACTHAAAVFVYHLEGVRQLSDRWYTLMFQEYTDSCL